ncbi:BON domain-containing protein [Chryseolinea sp. H1M3-3]|uniref:BON domain-containing protein n=1 Tax=Chryseolinea sp. H1M3-3 TaxID=3034144 RepID=UPI0023ED228F|nr:BON domain-containing protein [Chryseolinea sp. H1M3-3]
MKTNDEIQKDVMAEIKWDSQLRDVFPEIGVSVKDGVVTLTGTVDNYGKKLAAEHAAQRVQGVKVVASDIEVKIPAFGMKTDTQIAEAINNALRWNSAINEDKIEVKVDNGWVDLDGEVEWEYQKIAAQNSVEDLLGVKGVTNNIHVKPTIIDSKDIKKRITEAFHRNATIDSGAIELETSGSEITLKGKVKSWAERKEAERVAWSSPGVLAVNNQIEIDAGIFV